MKSKILRMVVIIIIIITTLLVSNYYISYYKVSGTNLDIINSLDKGLSDKSIITETELNDIFDNTETLDVTSENIESFINTNDDLSFFDGTKNLNLDYYYDGEDDELTFDLTDEGLENILNMRNLEGVNFNVKVDDYYLKRLYSFSYTDEDVEDFSTTLKEGLKEENSHIIDTLKDDDIEVKINIEVVKK